MSHDDTENPDLPENHEGACKRCECPAYDGLPSALPSWIRDEWEGEAMPASAAIAIVPDDDDRPPAAVKPESYYRDLLAAQVGGRTEVTLPFGRADVMTGTMVWEVEPASRWREGVAQALQYAAQVPQRGAVALYGNGVQAEKVQARLASLPAPGLELWWLAGDLFVRVKEIKPRA
jgi:hypothetical protein